MNIDPSRIAIFARSLDADARTTVSIAQNTGFAGLLFDAYSPALSIPELSATGLREFRHVLASHDIGLVGLSGDVGANGFGPDADVDRLIDRIDRAMQAAAGLASPLICIEMGRLATPPKEARPAKAISAEQAGAIIIPSMSAPAEPDPELSIKPDPANDSLRDQINSAMVELGIRADRYNTMVAFRSSLASFAALEQAVLSARCPWFGIDLDPVAILNDEWSADQIFSRLGSLIRHVRARDAVVGSDHRTRPSVLGSGGTDWPQFLARLDQSGYHGWLTIDPTELIDRVGAARSAHELLVGKKA